MSGRPRLRDQEAGFLYDLWRELRTLEADYGSITSVMAMPALRPGVFNFRIEFTPLSEKAGEIVGRQSLTIEFPNASTQTLAGALYAASLRLTHQVAECYHVIKSGTGF